jgi:hypothetical protein
MEITLQKSNQLKAIAILMMLFLHLFNRDYNGLFYPVFFIGAQPISYYISLFCDACVPIFCFVSGYGLYFKFQKNNVIYRKECRLRILRLYINYWIILMLFAVLLGLFLNIDGYPGNSYTFFLNFIGLDNSYNSAWWFFFTYLLLIISSTILFRLINKASLIFFFILCILIYLFAFYFRVYKPNLFESELLNWLQRQLSLYGTSLLPFITGAIALKQKWNTNLSLFFKFLPYKNAIALFSVFLLVVIHGFIPNFIIAPFLAVPFLFLFIQIKLPIYIDNILNFISPHVTNMWLVHMFFYMIYFKKFIYSATFIIPIFLILVVCTILSSIIINKLNVLIIKKVKL